MARRSREPTLTESDRSALRQLCEDLGDRSADASGFVPIRNLLQAFQAELIVRPMLVEGMLASINPEAGANRPQRWAVLIDSETNSVSEEAVRSEAIGRTLGARVRNTVAHELAHSVAFRYSELGLRLSLSKRRDITESEFVQAIERETEKLSPLMLVPTAALTQLVTNRQEPLDASMLAEFAHSMGVSREVLISRLSGLPRGGATNLRERAGLYRLGVGMGVWTEEGKPSLLEWPIFHNFERTVLPSFMALLVAGRRKAITAPEIIADPEFALLGGDCLVTEWESRTGTETSPGQERMWVRFTVEKAARRPGARFIYAATGTLIRPERVGGGGA